MAGPGTQVLVRFTTKLPAELRVPETPVAVPATVKRLGLSQVINHLLALDPARPFDFLIDGELLRKSLEEHLLDHSLSAESTLTVEYVPAVVPPQHKHSQPHDDWVNCVTGSLSGQQLASGSSDGTIRIWNGSVQCVATAHAHGSGVNAVVLLPAHQGSLLLTAGKDHSAKLWQIPSEEASTSGESQLQLVATYTSHTDAVESLALSPDGSRFVSTAWDGRVLIWNTGRSITDGAVSTSAVSKGEPPIEKSSKKRKVAAAVNGGADGTVAVAAGGVDVTVPIAEMSGHLHCVSSSAWPVESVLYTGGWDHSVRRWDVASGINTDTYNGSKAITCLACSTDSPNLVALGSTDRALRLWDCRSRAAGDALAIKAMAPHGGWISAVAWSPSSAFHLATGSHDKSVKLWDVRTSVPLGTLSDAQDKVFAVGWAGGRRLLAGGADCQLRVYDMDGDGTVPASVTR